MSCAPFFVRTAGLLAALALCWPAAAPAQTIDISLNVFYADPADVDSGGDWEIVAKSSGSGIAALSLNLTGISPTAAQRGPRGIVNGNRAAGFSIFTNVLFPEGFRNINLGQETFNPDGLEPGEEQGVFYGVGTLENGAPNWPDAPPGSNSLGPAFTTLSDVLRVPWADAGDVFGESAWDVAARLVSGTFAIGVTPSFFTGTSGQVFTALGTSTEYGAISQASTINTFVRTNFTVVVPSDLPGDFNQDGAVDAADFVLWRKNNGTGNTLPNDNNLGVPIGAAHYDLWRENFGNTAPGAGAALAAVPEPTSLVLLATAALLMLAPSRRPCR